VGILESAELTGNLDTVLNQLADYIERDTKARAKVKAAMIYPAVVACMSVVTVAYSPSSYSRASLCSSSHSTPNCRFPPE